MEGVLMCTSYEFVYELNENKGQFARIRDENGKFRFYFCFYFKCNPCLILS